MWRFMGQYSFLAGALVGLASAMLLAIVAWVVSERRRGRSGSLANLRDQERQLRTLVGNLPGVAYRCLATPGHAFEFASSCIEEVLGYTAAELGVNGIIRFSSLVHPDDRHRVASVVFRAIDRHERFTVMFRIIHRDGSIRWLWDRGIGVYDRNGEAEAIEGFATDITELRRNEEERARLLEEAQRTVASREDFLSMAMHDIRSPLTALKLHVQASLRRMSMTPDFSNQDSERALHKIESQVERMRLLIDDLLDVTRAAAGRLEVRLQELDLCAVALDAAKRHRPELDQAGCELNLHLDEHVIGRWDWLRLEQVLSNLLSNAAKYGGGRPVDLFVHQDGQFARLEVRDHGIGLSHDDRDRMFGRYERFTADHRSGSSGLGLWIVKMVVQALGGEVDCLSDGPGRGTTFVVILPLAGPGVPLETTPAPNHVQPVAEAHPM